ncbi:MAG: hypothetical protein U0270_01770 [Labilithrix sp.]
MYREPAQRPTEGETSRASKPTERLAIARGAGPTAALGVVCVAVSALVYVMTSPNTAAAIILGLLTLFALVVTRVLLRPRVVEIDYAEGRIRCHPRERPFHVLSHARAQPTAGDWYLLLAPLEGEEVLLAQGSASDVDEAANAINVALAGEYESVRVMPDGLARAMKALDRGFPLSGLSKLTEVERQKRVDAFLRELPVTELEVHNVIDGLLHVAATSHGVPVTFVYSVRKDRIEVAATAKSPHGHIELVRRGEPDIGNGWVPVAQGVLVNGETNRAAVESFPRTLRERIVSEVVRLRLRSLHIGPEETRAVSQDGLRDLRDPHARVTGMLALVIEIAQGLA